VLLSRRKSIGGLHYDLVWYFVLGLHFWTTLYVEERQGASARYISEMPPPPVLHIVPCGTCSVLRSLCCFALSLEGVSVAAGWIWRLVRAAAADCWDDITARRQDRMCKLTSWHIVYRLWAGTCSRRCPSRTCTVTNIRSNLRSNHRCQFWSCYAAVDVISASDRIATESLKFLHARGFLRNLVKRVNRTVCER